MHVVEGVVVEATPVLVEAGMPGEQRFAGLLVLGDLVLHYGAGYGKLLVQVHGVGVVQVLVEQFVKGRVSEGVEPVNVLGLAAAVLVAAAPALVGCSRAGAGIAILELAGILTPGYAGYGPAVPVRVNVRWPFNEKVRLTLGGWVGVMLEHQVIDAGGAVITHGGDCTCPAVIRGLILWGLALAWQCH